MLSDVVAALATPPGRSALAVVRVSGAGAFDVVRQVVPTFRAEPRVARLAAFVAAASASPFPRRTATPATTPSS